MLSLYCYILQAEKLSEDPASYPFLGAIKQFANPYKWLTNVFVQGLNQMLFRFKVVG